MLRLGIYIRVSTEKQDENFSKNHQLLICDKFIKNNFKDYTIKKIIYDDTMSASLSPRKSELSLDFPSEYNYEQILHRPALKKLLNDSKYNNIDAVVVYCHDRLSRNTSEINIIKSTLSNYGIKLYFAKSSEICSKDNPILDVILYWLSENEAYTLSSRAYGGGYAATLLGKWPGGLPPFGYTLMHKNNTSKKKMHCVLQKHPEESKIVAKIFDWYLEGFSPNEIANKVKLLKGSSITSHKWNRHSILDILKNETYTGYLCWNKRGGKRNPSRHNKSEYIKSDYIEELCIIPHKTWEEANKIISSRKISSKADASHFLFKNIVKCKYCGTNLATKNHGKKQNSYYYCNNENCLNHFSVKESSLHEIIQNYFENTVANSLSNNDTLSLLYNYYLELLEEKINKIYEDIIFYKSYISQNKILLEKHDTEINNIKSNMFTGKYSKSDKAKKIFLINSISESKSVYKEILEGNTAKLLYLNNLTNIKKKDIDEFKSSLTSFFTEYQTLINKSDSNEKKILIRALNKLFNQYIESIIIDSDLNIEIIFK